tara:strand:+ start:273 stop:542 length:270 start_codon:yes stop_codon:yes gene_type:complete
MGLIQYLVLLLLLLVVVVVDHTIPIFLLLVDQAVEALVIIGMLEHLVQLGKETQEVTGRYPVTILAVVVVKVPMVKTAKPLTADMEALE